MAENLDITWSDATGLAPDEADMITLEGDEAEQCVLVVRK